VSLQALQGAAIHLVCSLFIWTAAHLRAFTPNLLLQ